MASHRQQRVVFGLFALLTLVFSANIFLLQPRDRTRAGKRINFPGSVSMVETGGIAGTEEPVAIANVAAPAADPNADLGRSVARELAAKGYMPKGSEESQGPVFTAAIMAFEWDSGASLTGVATPALLEQLVLGSGGSPGRPRRDGEPPGPAAEQVIRTVQQSLSVLGYPSIKVDGRVGAATQAAIRSFEQRQGLPQTGRISGDLVARLVRLAGQGRLQDRG